MAPISKVVVGLGNPGNNYYYNRHNVGFLAIEAIAKSYEARPFSKKLSSYISEFNMGSQKAILVKPDTFMNCSGLAVAKILNFYKLSVNALWVIHDELELDPFKLRYKLGGSAGGHNGLKSINTHCGSNFNRLKIGIGRPANKEDVSNYVLGNFTKSEYAHCQNLICRLASSIPLLLEADDPASFLNTIIL